MVVLLL